MQILSKQKSSNHLVLRKQILKSEYFPQLLTKVGIFLKRFRVSDNFRHYLNTF